MRSSTSSSNERLPHVRWKGIWIATVTAVAIVIGLLEICGRLWGFSPSIEDDALSWCYCMNQIGHDDPNEVALIGTSRVQLGVNSGLLGERLNRTVVQLGINGSGPIPVLQHLSEDEHFRGIVVCDMNPGYVFSVRPQVDDKVLEYIARHSRESVSEKVERSLRASVQSNMVCWLHDLTPSRVLPRLIKGRTIAPSYLVTLDNRTRLADYSKADKKTLQLPAQRRKAMVEGSSLEAVREKVARIEEMVCRIQSHGGQVVFVTMPTDGELKQLEDRAYPRQKYWDVLAANTTAITLHYEDYPSLRLPCPDGSHMDYRDARKFTEALANLIQDKVIARTMKPATTPQP